MDWAYVVGVIVLVIGVLVSIGLHELGHMIPAKKFGVPVTQYFIGFGPTLWSRKRGETEYGLKAIPLGGYVRITGMIPAEDAVKPVRGSGAIARLIADARESSVEDVPEGQEHRAFYHLSWWRKVIVMAGGPLVNLILAVAIFTGVTMVVGVPTPQPTVESLTECIGAPGSNECTADDPAAPAVAAGVQPGDTILSVAGVQVETWEDLTGIIDANAGQTVPVVVERDGVEVPLTATIAVAEKAVRGTLGELRYDAEGELLVQQTGFLGIYPQFATVKQGPGYGAQLTGTILRYTGKAIANLPSLVFHAALATFGKEERDPNTVSSIVGVGRIAGEIATADVEGYENSHRVGDMLNLLAGLNLALFAFNMIPLVPLDGGHVASALWQAIKNGIARIRGLAKPLAVDVARLVPLSYAVWVVLLAMGVMLMVADVVAPVSFT